MLGLCAEDAHEGVAALKEWVGALELPRCPQKKFVEN